MKKNAKKITMTTAFISAASLGIIANGAGDIKADSVPSTTQEMKQATQSIEKQTQNNVDKAKANLDLATEKVKTEKSIVNDAKKMVDEANNNVVEQKQKVETTQEAVNQAKNEKKAAENNLKNKQDAIKNTNPEVVAKDIENTKKQLNDKQQAQKQNEKALEEAKKTQVQAQDKVNTAQSNLNDAQIKNNEALKQINDINNEIDKLQIDKLSETKKMAQAQVDTAQKALEEAKKVASNKEEAINNSTQKVNEAALAEEQAQKGLDMAQKALEEAKAKLANIEKQNPESLNPLDVPTEYTPEALEKASKELSEEFRELSLTGIGLNLKFVYSEADEAEKVDYKHLTAEQLKEINIFAIDLINQVRTKFNLKPLILNQDAINLAKKIADGYLAKNEFIMQGASHDLALLQNRGENISASLVFDTEKSTLDPKYTKLAKDVNYHEQFNNYRRIETMADLKSVVYSDILGLYFDDSASRYGHALNFLSPKYQYVAVAPIVGTYDVRDHKKMGKAEIDDMEWHFIFAKPEDVNVANDINLNSVSPEVKAAQKEVDMQQGAYNEAKKHADTASNALAKAKEELNVVKSDDNNKIQILTANLNNAKVALNTAINDLAKANKAQEDLSMKLAAARENQKGISQEVDAKQSLLNKAKATLVKSSDMTMSVQKEIDSLNHDMDSLEAKLTDLKNELNTYNNSNEILIDLKNKVAAAEENVTEAQKNLLMQQMKLKEMQDKAVKADDQLQIALRVLRDAEVEQEKAQKTYDDAIMKLNMVTNIEKDAQKPMEIIKAHIMTSENKMTITTNKLSSNIQMTNKMTKDMSLPQTGETTNNHASIWGVIAIALASVLGLFGYKRKQD